MTAKKKLCLKPIQVFFTRFLLNLGLNSVDAIIERCKKASLPAGRDDTFTCTDGLLSFFTENLDDEILIKIQDNGIGIPKEKLNNIFNPFFTTKEDGTGLGLSIAHNIISSMGGTISVNSLSNRTEFLISFSKT